MFYSAKFTTEDGGYVVTFPDAPGCVTQGDTLTEARENAREALSGWLEAHLVAGNVLPEPKARRGGEPVYVTQELAVQLRRVRQRCGH